MKLKLDENLSSHLKRALRELGHQVATVAEEGLQGKSDTAVGTRARREGEILLTLDIEFADLRKYPPGTHPGIVLFRPYSLGPLTVNRLVLKFFGQTPLPDLSGCVVVVEPSRVRWRRPK